MPYCDASHPTYVSLMPIAIWLSSGSTCRRSRSAYHRIPQSICSIHSYQFFMVITTVNPRCLHRIYVSPTTRKSRRNFSETILLQCYVLNSVAVSYMGSALIIGVFPTCVIQHFPSCPQFLHSFCARETWVSSNPVAAATLTHQHCLAKTRCSLTEIMRPQTLPSHRYLSWNRRARPAQKGVSRRVIMYRP